MLASVYLCQKIIFKKCKNKYFTYLLQLHANIVGIYQNKLLNYYDYEY